MTEFLKRYGFAENPVILTLGPGGSRGLSRSHETSKNDQRQSGESFTTTRSTCCTAVPM
jgi:hypothetical protein